MSLMSFGPFDSDVRRAGDYWRNLRESAGETMTSRELTPRMDVNETDREVCVSVELPGVRKEDLKLDLQDRVMTVSGEHSENKEYEKANHHVSERRYGRFHRSVVLPPHLKTDGATAKYENGVLTVRVPKGDDPGTRRIPIA
ncbi:uncharacterized protein VTP21DRAFT_6589 [Calcarisporiella thermophila]|uniref:uncharacterized protein n=1 Tax=Calcarisporiella thermophila TaxID=911321 RepID=UPI0037430030